MYTGYNANTLPLYSLNLYFQKMAVGGFFFLSGLKLISSKLETPLRSFIKNRFYRIYLLYFFAVTSYSIIVYPYINRGLFPDFKNAIIHALGIQSILPGIFGNDYPTLWFVSILFLCYIFFIFTRKIVINKIIFIMVLGGAVLIVLTIHNLGKHYGVIIFRKDICIYLVYFGLGMLYAINRKNIEKIKIGILFFAHIFSFIVALCFFMYRLPIWNQELITICSYIVSNIALYILVFKILQKYRPSRQIKTLIQYTSYTSFCVFLFHRCIWSIMNFVWFNVSFLHFLYIIVLGTACIFVCCYKLQNNYNFLIRKWRHINH